ncbi:type I-E CRISPR-associated endonuclease Cas1e [Hyphomicrobium sulfonivorans]|uniref:type I-E CRISPR-associated endonuclease Cas1e n=1 Tax=Hyphomicrobium sulfonivorans TaxID=121290 RepID=UPI0015710F58|nr:type I-E CRISPR-associated endonuclease Cas1e [Hyphomicrobium sulfonivorans]MBI1650884.1 type I-E CRISPR-associated endonuclease Cas1 [Hyphomicrobium sulfonivorans]NSL72734.1 type I-E CRISPR-associated endonuclease Cas1 [Hyphomicrobium sulfonivorans]
MLVGRLGLDKARVPHADRHGVIYLDRGRLEVEDGCLRFVTAGGGALAAGDYQLPHQSVSILLIGPGSSVTHDALRILAAHGCALAAVGTGGVRFYTAPPLLPDTSTLARRQVMLWSQPSERIAVARAMYTLRFGEEVKARTLDMLRGMEGARLKRLYELTAQQFGVAWNGRRYDRNNPNASDLPNQAINHAASAVEAAAAVAVAATATIPQLGFIHEDSGQSFVLDVADLVRHDVTLPIAFASVKHVMRRRDDNLERVVRTKAAEVLTSSQVISRLIDNIKSLVGPPDLMNRSADVTPAENCSPTPKPAPDQRSQTGDD